VRHKPRRTLRARLKKRFAQKPKIKISTPKTKPLTRARDVSHVGKDALEEKKRITRVDTLNHPF